MNDLAALEGEDKWPPIDLVYIYGRTNTPFELPMNDKWGGCVPFR